MHFVFQWKKQINFIYFFFQKISSEKEDLDRENFWTRKAENFAPGKIYINLERSLHLILSGENGVGH